MGGFHAMCVEMASELMAVGQFSPMEVSAALPNPADLLVEKVRAGDLEAFEGLMLLTEKLVLGVAWRILGNRDLARDAAQETFLRVFRSLDRFRLGESFQAWICQITVNVCRDLARKRGPVAVDLEDMDNLPHEHGTVSKAGAEEALLLEERRSLVRGALKSLPSGERTALILRDIEGFPTEDVARVLGVRPVTIRTQVSSARSKIRAYCDQVLQRKSGGPA